jgi:hypothetical protein
MNLLNKLVLAEWINGDFRQLFLRRINRETKTQYISDVPKTCLDYDSEPPKYGHVAKWAKRFNKLPNGEIKARLNHRYNSDGHYELKIVENASKDLLCKYSFDEVFNSKILNKWLFLEVYSENYPLKEYNNEEDRNHPFAWLRSNDRYKLKNYLYELFNVPIYNLSDNYKMDLKEEDWLDEDDNKTIFNKSMTLFHVIHFKKKHYTIGFWLFEDKLVYKYDSGKSTW